MRGLPVTNGWSGLIDVQLRHMRVRSKDVFDRVAGSLLLALASPLLLLAVLAVRLDSSGPAFYTQVRVGERGRHFTMIKLRSMYIDADARREAVVAAGGDAGNEIRFQVRNCPTITSPVCILGTEMYRNITKPDKERSTLYSSLSGLVKVPDPL